MLGSGGETGHRRTWARDGPRRASYPRLGDWTLFSRTEENKRITFAFQDDQLQLSATKVGRELWTERPRETLRLLRTETQCGRDESFDY